MAEPGVPKGAEGTEPHLGLMTWHCFHCGKQVDARIQLKMPNGVTWSHAPSGWVHSYKASACSKECAEKFR